LAGYVLNYNSFGLDVCRTANNSVVDVYNIKNSFFNLNELQTSGEVSASVNSVYNEGIICVKRKILYAFHPFAYKPNSRKWRFSFNCFTLSAKCVSPNIGISISNLLAAKQFVIQRGNSDPVNTSVLLI
jgi:hypothetical protein